MKNKLFIIQSVWQGLILYITLLSMDLLVIIKVYFETDYFCFKCINFLLAFKAWIGIYTPIFLIRSFLYFKKK